MTLQQQADASQALLDIQELIDAGLVSIVGTIDASLAKKKLLELKVQGVMPSEKGSEYMGAALFSKIGGKLL